MGRALFSLAYAAPEPAVRIEPEPEVERYGRWSAWNRFDPDSDEFFQDAEYEAFIDPVPPIRRRHASVPSLDPAYDTEHTAETSDSGDSSDDQSSPVIPRSDIPVVLGGRPYINRPLTRTYTPSTRLEYTAHSSSPASYDSSPASLLPVHSPVSPQSPDLLDNPPFIPPPSFRQSTPDIERESRLLIGPPPSPPFRRTSFNVSGIQIMPATRSPSPDSLPVPATPPSATSLSVHAQNQSQAMLTPSPPPSVTPRFYSWQTHSIPALPTSPTIVRGNVHVHPTFPRRGSISTRVHIPSAIV